MSIKNDELKTILLDFQYNVPDCRNQWITIEVLRKIIYYYYDFRNGLDFTYQQLVKALNQFGNVEYKTEEGNETGFHRRSKKMDIIETKTRMTARVTFLLITLDTSTQPYKPLNNFEWHQLQNKSNQMNICNLFPSFLERFQMNSGWRKADMKLVSLRQKMQIPVISSPLIISYWNSPSAHQLF